MTAKKSVLKGKRVLAVDDEVDILDTIEDILDEVNLEKASDYQSASKKIRKNAYDLVILDIMGVNGLVLLEEAVARGIPAVMLTAHAINPETLMDSIRKGAISYLPKETLSELDEHLGDLFAVYEQGEPPWKLLFEKLETFFRTRFGADWKERDKEFWDEFDPEYQIGKGIQQRLLHNKETVVRGI